MKLIRSCFIYFIFVSYCRLEVRQASEGAHHVPGIVEANVESIREVWNALQAGSNARAVGSNNVNEHSSRSHWYDYFQATYIILIFFLRNYGS